MVSHEAELASASFRHLLKRLLLRRGRASFGHDGHRGGAGDGVTAAVAIAAVRVGVTLPRMRCFGLAQEQVRISSTASATIPKPVSAIITRQNGVMPPPSSSHSPGGGDTGAAGAAGDGGVMGGGWPVPKRLWPVYGGVRPVVPVRERIGLLS